MSSGLHPPRDLPVKIVVSDHARLRIRERFPGFKCARAIDEVRIAFREGRVSARQPAGFAGDAHAEVGIYAWTPDGERIYALRANEHDLTVTTAVRAFDKCDQARHGTMRVLRCPHGCVTECAKARRSHAA